MVEIFATNTLLNFAKKVPIICGNNNIDKAKKVLQSIKEAFMKAEYKSNSIIIKIGFVSLLPEINREGIIIQVPIREELILRA